METIRSCNDTYQRDATGWSYPWGAAVPGARDLTAADVLTVAGGLDGEDLVSGVRSLSDIERRWVRGERLSSGEAARLLRAGCRSDLGDLVLGMSAPELHPSLLLGVDDIAQLSGVRRATIDSYRARDLMVRPQVVHGRTPLWARPIVQRWLAERSRRGPAPRASLPRRTADPVEIAVVS